jgi:hypothetical protein
MTVPIMHVWNSGDLNVCGATPMACELRDGSVVTMGSANCIHEPFRLAIEAQGSAGRSANLGLCVEGNNLAVPCDRHVVAGTPDGVNTAPGAPADYIGAIHDWVRDRLADD